MNRLIIESVEPRYLLGDDGSIVLGASAITSRVDVIDDKTGKVTTGESVTEEPGGLDSTGQPRRSVSEAEIIAALGDEAAEYGFTPPKPKKAKA